MLHSFFATVGSGASAVPARDLIALAIGIIGAAIAYAQSSNRLPKWARTWLSRIGYERIENAIDYASRLSGMTSDQRRAEAVAYLVRLTEKELGFAVPTSIANLLVEFVYQRWKRR